MTSGRLLRFSITFLLSALVLSSCDTLPTHNHRVQKSLEATIQQRIFWAPYEAVWKAAQTTLKYPITLNNMENGILETDWVRALDGFIAPGQNKLPSAGVVYRIKVTLVKGKSNRKDFVRVAVLKEVQKQNNFFDDPEQVESDALEERIILYRIEREIGINEALKRMSQKTENR